MTNPKRQVLTDEIDRWNHDFTRRTDEPNAQVYLGSTLPRLLGRASVLLEQAAEFLKSEEAHDVSRP